VSVGLETSRWLRAVIRRSYIRVVLQRGLWTVPEALSVPVHQWLRRLETLTGVNDQKVGNLRGSCRCRNRAFCLILSDNIAWR
jgi:hypothetical protein